MSANEFLKGLVWRVGNGKQISIWDQKWIPKLASFKVNSPVKVLNQQSRVSALVIEELNCWNEKLLFDIFEKEETIQIYSIPLSKNGADAKIIWGYTKKAEIVSMEMSQHLLHFYGNVSLPFCSIPGTTK